jgi:hypothetical protein
VGAVPIFFGRVLCKTNKRAVQFTQGIHGEFSIGCNSRSKGEMKMNLILTFFLSQLFVVLCCAEAKAGNTRARFLSANNAMHFAWLNDNTVVKGDSRDHFSKVSSPQSTRPGIPYAFGIQAFKNRPTKIKDVISISSNDSMHFGVVNRACSKRRSRILLVGVRGQAMQ